MKNYNIYYLTIVFLVIMIFIPPLLRFAIPKDNTNKNSVNNTNQTSTTTETTTKPTSDIKTLKCSIVNPEITINTRYKSDEIIELSFSSKSLSEDSEPDSSILRDILNLKTVENSSFSDSTLSFDFTKNSFSDVESLKKYTRGITIQQSYYEQLGFTCNVLNE